MDLLLLEDAAEKVATNTAVVIVRIARAFILAVLLVRVMKKESEGSVRIQNTYTLLLLQYMIASEFQDLFL